MRGVLAKLRVLPRWAKVTIVGAAASAALGVVAALVFGFDASLFVAPLGGIAAWLGMRSRKSSPRARAIATEQRKRAQRYRAAARAAAAEKARDDLAARYVEAELAARRVGADDNNDPERVLKRHGFRTGPRRGSDR